MISKKLNYDAVKTRETYSLSLIFKTTLHEYFSPLFLSWQDFQHLKDKKDRLKNSLKTEEALRISARKALITMQEANCYNQGSLIQYTFLMAEKHKALKNVYRDKPADFDAQLEEKAKDLIYFLNFEFHKIVFRNFEIMHSYYLGRTKPKPRICLKGNFRTHHLDTIITVFRDHSVDYSADYEITENTGFEEIAKTGKYYLCNNIPKQTFDGKYKNPRLNTSKINKVKDQKELVKNWGEYWVDNKNESSNYKSTLIIPMTLWNNDLSEEFRDKINAKNIGRTIFGFLCIDHVYENYFNDNDIRTGYVFADILSNYVFQRAVYTDLSDTFGTILNEMANKVDWVSSDVPDTIKWESLHAIDDVNSDIELTETKNNYLFGLDEELREFVGKNPKQKAST